MTYNRDWFNEFPYWTFGDAVSTPVDMFPDEWKPSVSCPPQFQRFQTVHSLKSP